MGKICGVCSEEEYRLHYCELSSIVIKDGWGGVGGGRILGLVVKTNICFASGLVSGRFLQLFRVNYRKC